MDSEFGQEFTVAVATPDLKFNCAHFIAFQNFRERLHGHNYTVSVKLCGASVGNDGYLLDFGEVKRQCKLLCAKMNERFICPMLSDVLNINDDDASQICLTCQDGSYFSFPKGDVIRLPIVHSSTEEISRYFWCQLVRQLGYDFLKQRGVYKIELGVLENPTQSALFSCRIPGTSQTCSGCECKGDVHVSSGWFEDAIALIERPFRPPVQCSDQDKNKGSASPNVNRAPEPCLSNCHKIY